MNYNNSICKDLDVILAKVRWNEKQLQSLNDTGWPKLKDLMRENNIYMNKEGISFSIFGRTFGTNLKKYNDDAILNWLNQHVEQLNYITEFTKFYGGAVECKYDLQALSELIKTNNEKVYKAWVEDIESLIELKDILQKNLLEKKETKQEDKQEQPKQEQPKQEEKKGFFSKFKK